MTVLMVSYDYGNKTVKNEQDKKKINIKSTCGALYSITKTFKITKVIGPHITYNKCTLYQIGKYKLYHIYKKIIYLKHTKYKTRKLFIVRLVFCFDPIN